MNTTDAITPTAASAARTPILPADIRISPLVALSRRNAPHSVPWWRPTTLPRPYPVVVLGVNGWPLHDGLRGWWQDFAAAFEDIHFEVLRYTALDAQRVLTENRSQGHFRETGLPIDLRWASMFSVRNPLPRPGG